jgi:hypothetical protein
MTKSFHLSNLGSFGGNLTADIDGYVYTTISGVMSGRWDGKMTREHAREIAEQHRDLGDEVAIYDLRTGREVE